MDIRQYLSSKGIAWKEVRRPAGLQAIFNCPSCGEKDFALSLEDGAFNCVHEGKCGVHGSWYDFQRLYGDSPQILPSDRFIVNKKPKVYKAPERKVSRLSDRAVNFLRTRGFKDDVYSKFDLASYNDALVFVYRKDGEVTSYKFRGLTEKKFWREKDTAPTLYNMDKCGNNDTLYIVEGELDVIAIKHYDINAVSVPSGSSDTSWIEYNWEWLEQFKKIYMIYDNDSAGQEHVDKIAMRLGTWRCYNVKLPEKDPNECLLKGVSAEQIYESIAKADEYTLPHVKSSGEFIDEVCEYLEHKEKLYGVDTRFKGLTKILRGWRANEVTLWTGSNGSGKSTILNDVFLNLADKEERVCMLSLELPPRKYLRWLVMQDVGFESINADHVKATLSRLDPFMYIVNIVGSVKPDKLLSIFEFVCRKYGVSHFLIDSLMLVEFSMRNEYADQKSFVASLCSFTKNYDSHVHLVAHPRKGEDDNDRPDKVDVSGSGHITNLVDNVISVWRPTEEAKEKAEDKGRPLADNYLFVKKNREWGTHGKVELNFNPHSKSFTEPLL